MTTVYRNSLLFLLHSTSRSFFYLFLLEPRNRTTSLSNKPLKVISSTVESFRIDRHLDGEEKERNRHSRVDSSTGLLEAFRVPEKRGNGVKVSSVSTSLFFFFFSSYKSLLSIQSVATFKRAVATSIDPTLKKVTSICCHLPPFPSFFLPRGKYIRNNNNKSNLNLTFKWKSAQQCTSRPEPIQYPIWLRHFSNSVGKWQ